jgi:hypothetical protein
VLEFYLCIASFHLYCCDLFSVEDFFFLWMHALKNVRGPYFHSGQQRYTTLVPTDVTCQDSKKVVLDHTSHQHSGHAWKQRCLPLSHIAYSCSSEKLEVRLQLWQYILFYLPLAALIILTGDLLGAGKGKKPVAPHAAPAAAQHQVQVSAVRAFSCLSLRGFRFRHLLKCVL